MLSWLRGWFSRPPCGPTPPVAPYGDVPAPIAPVAPPKDYAPDPAPPAPAPKPKRKTLAAVVGLSVAGALFTAIPAEESGRTVQVTIDEADAAPVIRHISGKQYLKSYLDIAGVATACDGLTRDEAGRPIKIGQTYTEAQCTAMLERALIAHAEGVMKCTSGLALSANPALEKQREGPRFAAVSLAYNVGVANYCGSTARKRFNEWDFEGGCNAILSWNKARVKGVLRPVQGLTNRRNRERTVCLKGLMWAS